MLQGEILVFYRTFVLLRGHIFAGSHSLVHIYEMSQMNRLGLTRIYFYRFYIPDQLIRLANGVET